MQRVGILLVNLGLAVFVVSIGCLVAIVGGPVVSWVIRVLRHASSLNLAVGIALSGALICILGALIYVHAEG